MGTPIASANTLRCLITGASGVIGRPLISYLKKIGCDVSTWPRDSAIYDLNVADHALLPAEWEARCKDISVVIHLAGLAHQREDQAGQRERYFNINCNGTLLLAEAARKAGVKRFIFISSAKVFGEGGNRQPYDADTVPQPQDVYAQSKWQAEQRLIERYAASLELVVLRPPLVYGPEVKANFANLMRLALLPLPLPLAGIENRRTLIGIDNLIDLIALCMTSPRAAGGTWLCGDAAPYSLSDIIAAIRRAHDRRPHLFGIPSPLLRVVQTLLGASASSRLFGDFEMNCEKTFRELDWTPPFSMEQILRCGGRTTE